MRRTKTGWLLLSALTLLCNPLGAGEKALPADLAFVPPDGAGFIHVRLADVWKSSHLQEWRDTVLKAGEQTLKGFDDRFFPRPSSVERLTFLVPAAKMNNKQEHLVVIIATSQVIDRAAFLKFCVPGVAEEKTPNGSLFVDAKKKMEIYFIDDKTLAVGSLGGVRSILTQPRQVKGNLSEAIQLANAGKPVVVALNGDVLPPQALEKLPPAFLPLLKAKLATTTLDLGKEVRVDVRLVYGSAEQSQEAERAARKAIEMARMLLEKSRQELAKKIQGDGKPASLDQLPEAATALVGLGMLNQMEEYLVAAPLQQKGKTLQMSLKLPEGAQVYLAAAGVGSALFYLRSDAPARSPDVEPVPAETPKEATPPRKPQQPKQAPVPKAPVKGAAISSSLIEAALAMKTTAGEFSAISCQRPGVIR